MLRRFIFTSKSKPGKEPLFFKVNIIARDCRENGIVKAYLLICPTSDMITWYPASLVQANKLKIEDNECFYFSSAMYKFWFGNTILDEYKRLSQIALANFEKITTNSSFILDSEKLYNITFTFLQSHSKGSEVSYYCLGDLLKSWLNDTKLQPKPGLYLLKVSVCFSTSNYIYVAWDTSNHMMVRVKGKSENCYKLYLDFKKISSFLDQTKYPDISTIMRLFDVLNISY
jgi:hypothetical protein